MPLKRILFIPLAILVVAIFLVTSFLIFSKKPSTSNNNSATSTAAAVDNSWHDVQARGELLVGTNMPYGSMEFLNDQGVADGFDIDVTKEIASRLGLKYKIINYDWDKLFSTLNTGTIDVAIAGISITPERTKQMLFSVPYNYSGIGIIVKKNNTTIKTVTDLQGKKVGSQKDTTNFTKALTLTDKSKVFGYNDYGQQIATDLRTGKIDAIVVGSEAIFGIIKDNPDFKMPTPPIEDASDFAGIAAKLNNNALMDQINTALREMKRDDTLKKLENKWLNLSTAQ